MADPKASKSAPRSRWRFGSAHPPPLRPEHALFLDIDGTLAEIAATPREARVDLELLAAIPSLRARHGEALALVTGRSITDVDRMFPGWVLPVAGQHGCERRDGAGTLHLHSPDPVTLGKLRELFAGFASRHEGLLLEDKGATVALHYRQSPHLAGPVHSIVRSLLETPAGAAFRMLEGKQLVEIRPDGRDKGAAILDFMQEPPFAGRMPVFVGDDLTDEDGFAAVASLRGWSIKVGKGRSCARYRLANSDAVKGWLMAGISGAPRVRI
jgi:trehalose 6-phosphate phosphatase